MSIFRKFAVVSLVVAALFSGSLKQILKAATQAEKTKAEAGESRSGGSGL